MLLSCRAPRSFPSRTLPDMWCSVPQRIRCIKRQLYPIESGFSAPMPLKDGTLFPPSGGHSVGGLPYGVLATPCQEGCVLVFWSSSCQSCLFAVQAFRCSPPGIASPRVCLEWVYPITYIKFWIDSVPESQPEEPDIQQMFDGKSII